MRTLCCPKNRRLLSKVGKGCEEERDSGGGGARGGGTGGGGAGAPIAVAGGVRAPFSVSVIKSN